MKNKNLLLIVSVALFTAIFAFVLSSALFHVPRNRSTKVPTAGSITTTFPDIQHDPSYNTIFNDNALDPAVPLTITNNSNNQPFNGSGQ